MSELGFPTGDNGTGGGSSVTSVTGTAPIAVGGTATDPVIGISAATTLAAGSMSAANFTKLAGIAASATNTPLTANTPQAVGTAAVGTGTAAARDDHVHALPAVGTAGTYANPSSMTTDAQGRVSSVTAGSAPVALASTTPAAVGTAAVGVGTTAARSDHVHALPSTGTAGTYASPSSMTTDAQGRVTSVTAGSTPAPATRLVSTSTGLQGGGDLSADRTLSIDSTVTTLTGTQTLTNKTLTSPAISGPTFSGTEGGTRTIGGTPTLGVNLAAGGFKVTGLGAPTAASSDAATATYAEAQKTGAAGPPFYLNTGQSFAVNGYIGIGGDGSSTLSQNIVPFRVPAAGVIRDLTVHAFANAPSTLHVLIYKATSPTTMPTYSATALDATITSGTNTGADNTHSVSVNAGDLIVGFCGTAWSANGAQISYRYIPN